MTDRWFNELTHKYLEYVRMCHLKCYRGPLQYEVRDAFDDIKLYGINDTKVKEFADLLQQAINEFFI